MRIYGDGRKNIWNCLFLNFSFRFNLKLIRRETTKRISLAVQSGQMFTNMYSFHLLETLLRVFTGTNTVHFITVLFLSLLSPPHRWTPISFSIGLYLNRRSWVSPILRLSGGGNELNYQIHQRCVLIQKMWKGSKKEVFLIWRSIYLRLMDLPWFKKNSIEFWNIIFSRPQVIPSTKPPETNLILDVGLKLTFFYHWEKNRVALESAVLKSLMRPPPDVTMTVCGYMPLESVQTINRSCPSRNRWVRKDACDAFA